jgi:hypothetical protein
LAIALMNNLLFEYGFFFAERIKKINLYVKAYEFAAISVIFHGMMENEY